MKVSKLNALTNKLYPNFNFDKRLKLFEIRGLESSIINKLSEEFVEDKIIPQLIPETLELLNFHQAERDIILLISGGYLPYLSVFAKKYNIKYVSGTKMEIRNNKATGMIQGKDCIREQKVLVLEYMINEFRLISSEPIAYSVSITDLPILKWASRGVVFSKSNNNNWAEKHGFDIVFYGKDK